MLAGAVGVREGACLGRGVGRWRQLRQRARSDLQNGRPGARTLPRFPFSPGQDCAAFYNSIPLSHFLRGHKCSRLPLSRSQSWLNPYVLTRNEKFHFFTPSSGQQKQSGLVSGPFPTHGAIITVELPPRDSWRNSQMLPLPGSHTGSTLLTLGAPT